MRSMYHILKTARPRQWTKNILVFAGLVFARQVANPEKLIAALIAFVGFCLVSSSVYLINDVVDRKKDAQHPVKRNRPIAAGVLSPLTASVAALVFVGVSLVLSFMVEAHFAFIIGFYLLMNLAYSFKLKHVVIVDVLIIAAGFMLRIIGGTVAIHEPASSWLIICATFLTLFLALGKRRAELAALGDNASGFRKTLTHYTPDYLNNLMNIVITGCIMSYALYTLDDATIAKVGSHNLIWTFPFVIYGLFRYMYLLEIRHQGEAPEDTIFKDVPLLIAICCFGLVVFAVMYWG